MDEIIPTNLILHGILSFEQSQTACGSKAHDSEHCSFSKEITKETKIVPELVTVW